MGSILFGGKNQLPDRRLVLLCGCYFRLLKSSGISLFEKRLRNVYRLLLRLRVVTQCGSAGFLFPVPKNPRGGDGLSLQMVVKSGCSHRCIGGVRRIIFKLNIEIGSCGMEDACGKVKNQAAREGGLRKMES